MHSYDYWLILAFFALVLLPAPFLGRFYYKVMEGQRNQQINEQPHCQ